MFPEAGSISKPLEFEGFKFVIICVLSRPYNPLHTSAYTSQESVKILAHFAPLVTRPSWGIQLLFI